ncbi:hypothetical protein halTADL_3107 [Halohasta litchfieldiae]|jgi:predicted RNA-binding Zn-ribbon protein involved in translation (DUF1610 family)|uniref:Uncharacterized protein n=1 Tax=Halohasta litchfieldiae TaxID=1073996 RepID=A0A1H6RGE4_9EURY|nr:hypothetical protein [Halohasta litchfieldiae]ATW89809.1 hypothetical protein halTADL_3107 [Halohasta litchfieldiae]SEI52384.1 hypothetical protein SAMN05444271_10217 [Halohasta litchfieldiae]
MPFQWLSANACPSCNIIPTATRYDDFGYPLCPNCGTVIRSAEGGEEQQLAATAQSD